MENGDESAGQLGRFDKMKMCEFFFLIFISLYLTENFPFLPVTLLVYILE
jgi:hypothetical protein